MEEHNRSTLRRALAHLPAHEPPPQLWSHIAQEMELQQGLRRLPVHQPPEQVWEQITDQLPQAKVRRMWMRPLAWTAAAAAIAFLFWIRSAEATFDPVEPTYTATLVHASPSPDVDWDSDAAALEQIVRQYRRSPVVSDEHTRQRLLDEWAELDAARRELRVMANRYGEDGQLLRQLGAIEQARSAVVQQMAIEI